MKATLITIAMVCIILLEQGFSQVTGVKYLMKYNTTTCKFDACIVITAGSATTAPQRRSSTRNILWLYQPVLR